MPQDESHMSFAIEISLNSVSEDERYHPLVGALLVDNAGQIIEKAHRGELGGNGGQHAEYVLLEKCKLSKHELKYCTLVTTLEPCVRRGTDKTPCSNRIISSGIKAVQVGMIDPNPVIRGNGIHEMLMAGIDVTLSSAEVCKRIYEINTKFVEQFLNAA